MPRRRERSGKGHTSEGEQGVISLETLIRGTCEPHRLLDIVENLMLFQEARGGLIKVVAKNHQFLGVEQAPEAVRQIQKNQGRLGVFWHTQGSGKSFSIQALQGETCADWRKRQQSRAAVRVFIEDMVWQLPEDYTEQVCREKSAIIYQHIYDNYWGADRSIYSQIVAAA